jgi:WD40 repeat protein
MRLKHTPTQATQTTQTLPTSSYTPVPTVANQTKTKSQRRWSIGRVALWACFLIPLAMLGTQVPAWVGAAQHQLMLLRPEVRESLVVPRGFEAVTSSFSPDGKTLAMVVSKQYPQKYSGPTLPAYVSFWDWRTRTERGIKIPLASWASPLIWRKGGKELLLPGDKALLVEVATGEVTRLPRDISLATSPDGTCMIRNRTEEAIKEPVPGGGYREHLTAFSVADVDTGKTLARLALPKNLPQKQHFFSTRHWNFSQNNTYVTLTVPPQGVENKGTLICWRVGQATPLWQIETMGIQAATFDPTGTRLYSIIKDSSRSEDGVLNFDGTQHLACLETATGKKLWSTAAMLAWDEDILANGERIFLRVSDGTRIFDAKTGKQGLWLLDDVVDPHGFSLPEIAISPDGQLLAERHAFGIRLRPTTGGN